MPYLTPNEIPEGDDCRPLSIPASSEWLAFFGGALTELTKTYNWQQFGALTVDETVAKMESILNNWYSVPCAACTTPGGYRVIRIGPGGHLEQLNESGDWEPATDEYYIPPPDAREGGTDEEQICLAALNAVNILEQLYEQWTEWWEEELELEDVILALIAWMITKVPFAWAPIVSAIAAFLVPIFLLIYAFLEYATADVWDEEFSDQLVCMLVACGSNDAGVVTFDWDCFNAQMNDLTDNSGTLSELQLRLYAQVGYILYFIGGGDALNLAGGTTEITSGDCDYCAPVITLTAWNFASLETGWGIFPSEVVEAEEFDAVAEYWFSDGGQDIYQLNIAISGTVNLEIIDQGTWAPVTISGDASVYGYTYSNAPDNMDVGTYAVARWGTYGLYTLDTPMVGIQGYFATGNGAFTLRLRLMPPT